MKAFEPLARLAPERSARTRDRWRTVAITV
jgi:hypothetical protein